MEAHAKRYSASYRKGWDSFWKSDFDEMARKTIIRQLISKWGIMSVDMEKAYESDMAVINDDGTSEYIDNVADEPAKFVDVLDEGNVTEIAEEVSNETDGE
jgi:recombination protein RecT